MVLTAQEAELMRAPEVQRLRSIRMCNINSLLVSGASEISRFEHSLGVVRLAKEWSLASNADVDSSAIVSAAAILHDIKTGPFGHSLEYILNDTPELADLDHQRVGQDPEESFFQRTRANVSYMGVQFTAHSIMGRHWSQVTQTIAGSGPLGPLISGTMDLDNIDNVVRLAYHVGLAEHRDADLALALARDIRVQEHGLSISRESVPLVERWQFLRHRLYRYLLHDWAEFSAKGMLTKAIERATEAEIIGTDSWILTDDGLISRLISMSIGENQDVGALIKRVMLADLYHPISLLKTHRVKGYAELSKPSTKRSLEAKISKIVGCPCIFHVILDRAKTDRKVALYIRDTAEHVVVGEDSHEMLVGLFSSRALSDRMATRALAELRNILRDDLEDAQLMSDPLEDPFQAVSSQLKLI
ncbi:HD domain-containing protein [Mesorhizobium sp. WSM1293]|uniref:HD domain-containing protein n=1 Tax=Mesorhizobium sp. WSM1293 TaxID=1040984 RepID=UPI00047F425C|nr:HD domain-containing protein [Mesorhizobium sp. WSM1293]